MLFHLFGIWDVYLYSKYHYCPTKFSTKKLSSPQKFDSMFICSFLVLFCLPKKGTKKGHKLAITAANLIARSSFCTTVWPSYRSLLTVRRSTVLLAGLNRSSFAFVLDQLRNPSKFNAILVGQQCLNIIIIPCFPKAESCPMIFPGSFRKCFN